MANTGGSRRAAAILALAVLTACSLQRSGQRPDRPLAATYGTPDAAPAVPSPAGDVEEETAGASGSSFDELNDVGAAARDLLRPEPFTQIVLEVDWFKGAEPDPEAIELMRFRLHQVTRKPVVLRGGSSLGAGKGRYSIEEIWKMSEARTTHNVAPEASIWVVFLDGEAAENRFAFGWSAASTVIAIFPDKIEDLTPFDVRATDVLATTLVHELGHLLGLVNLAYASPRDRESSEHPGHSTNLESVMYHAFDHSFGASLTPGRPPPNDFDADDLADLRAVAQGEL